jgi:hypothetical protein
MWNLVTAVGPIWTNAVEAVGLLPVLIVVAFVVSAGIVALDDWRGKRD